MLTLKSRQSYETLLDSAVLQPQNDAYPAIIYVQAGDQPDELVTRRRFRQEAETYAAALKGLGVGPRDLVIIAHTQSLESIFAFWGALLIGAIPSMFPTLTEKLDPDVYMQNMAELVRFSDVAAILTTDDFKPLLAEKVTCRVVASAEIHSQSFPDDFSLPNAPDPDAIAFLQHSSGTTGLQKGVALSHSAVLNQLASYSEAIQLTPADTIVSWLPLYHDMGLIAGFMLPLVQGIPLVLMSPFDWVRYPALLFHSIYDYQGTLTWLPNFAYNHCARRIRRRDLEEMDLSSMRLFINCSEPVRDDSHALFLERFGELGVTPKKLAVSYAMAENTFAVTQTAPGKAPFRETIERAALEEKLRAKPVSPQRTGADVVKMVSCGKPIPNSAVVVLDDAGKPLPERHVGELAVRSDCMLTEYYKRPDLDPFVDGWFRTGDRGYIAHGEVYVVGRSKDLIINAGKNVYPQDLEAIVNQVEGVHAGRAVVFGVPDEKEGTELIAVVAEVAKSALEEDGGISAERHKAIVKAIRQEVARQTTVTIKFVTLVDDKWLIKTSSGKLARNANRDKWLAERAA